MHPSCELPEHPRLPQHGALPLSRAVVQGLRWETSLWAAVEQGQENGDSKNPAGTAGLGKLQKCCSMSRQGEKGALAGNHHLLPPK